MSPPTQPHAVPQNRVKRSMHRSLAVRSGNSHNHLLLAVRVLWLHFQLLHVAVTNLGPLPGALALGPWEKERAESVSVASGVSYPPPPSALTQSPGLLENQQLAVGFSRFGRDGERGSPRHSPSTRAAHNARSSRSSVAVRSLMLAGGVQRSAARPGSRDLGKACWSEMRPL